MAAQNHGASRRIFGAQIPQPHLIVRAADGNPVAIRADRHRFDRVIVASMNLPRKRT
jgi:hypothetical protein